MVLLVLIGRFAQSQSELDAIEVVDYSDKKSFNIGKILIDGAPNRDRNAIKSIAGLREGNKIEIPGQSISKAIKSLMKLRLFDDVQIFVHEVRGDTIDLVLRLVERPTLARYSYRGVKKSSHDDLNDIVKEIVTKGGIVTEAQKDLAAKAIANYFIEKGMLDAKVKVLEIPDEKKPGAVRLVFDIDKGDRVKIQNIQFVGNMHVPHNKLRKQFKNTRRKGSIFHKSKFIKKDYEEDKKSLIAYLNTLGYRDARIISDTMWREPDGDLWITINLHEGPQYKFGDIKWKGNSLYTDEQLSNVLGISKGDIYNPELLQNRLSFSRDGRDVSSLYMDDGYLFFDVKPTEVAINDNSVDLEMRIYEGPQATVDRVIIKGNDRTHEHVVRRIIRTRPGQKFSRSDIIRSQREIINLGYFNPENMGINTPVNPTRGTVDIEYNLEERPSDQLELSAGYGGTSGLIGTLGMTFNNFSLRNLRNRKSWSPLPTGDGQKLSLRVQSNSRFFKSYNFSFTEPWLGGKRPNSLTVGAVHSAIDYSRFGLGGLNITRIFAGIGRQLTWPDDFFSSSTTLNLENIALDDYNNNSFNVFDEGRFITLKDGNFRNLSITQTFTRSSVADPLYPRRGSRISFSIQLTPPYSLFREDNFYRISDEEAAELIEKENIRRGPVNPLTKEEEQIVILSRENALKYKFLEYHKWKFQSEWYFNIFDKFVFAANMKFGFLGGYSKKFGAPPFERFQVGGDGLTNQNSALTGTEIISLRGYETDDINNNRPATVYNKFNIELRYPLSLNPTSTIYAKIFAQGGNAWESFKDYNPFDMKRSVGAGVRIFLPMFGLLGFDYSFGFDKNLPEGSNFSQYGKFNIILGFEPE